MIASGQKPNRSLTSVDLQFESDNDDDDDDDDGPTDTETESSESEDGSRPISEIRELFLAAEGSITSLFKLSIVIRNPTPRGRYAKLASMASLDDSFDIGHVWQKYPRARQAPWLVERLGKANTRRRQYFRYRQQHGDKLSKEPEEQAREVYLKNSDAQVIATAQPGPAPGRETLSHISGSKPVTKITHTTATTFVAENLSDHIEEHSNTGRSVTSYATSITEDPNSLRIPPPPEMSADGKPFVCPYCCTVQIVESRRSWKYVKFAYSLCVCVVDLRCCFQETCIS